MNEYAVLSRIVNKRYGSILNCLIRMPIGVKCHVKYHIGDLIHVGFLLQLTYIAIDRFVYNKVSNTSCVFLFGQVLLAPLCLD